MMCKIDRGIRALLAHGLLALVLVFSGGNAFAAMNDPCDAGTGPGSGIYTDTAGTVCTATSALSQDMQCSGNYYYDASQSMCVLTTSSCQAGGLPGTYTLGTCNAATTPTAGMSCGGSAYYNGSACVADGTSSGACSSPNVWNNGICVAPTPSSTPPTATGSLGTAAGSLGGVTNPGAIGSQQPLCVNTSPFIGYGLGIVAGSTLCYGTAADLSGTSVYAYHTNSSNNWDGLNVQDLYARGNITAIGSLNVYGGAQIYSPDLNSGVVVVNGQVLAASTDGANSSSVSVIPGSVTTASSGGGAATSVTVAPGSATTASAAGSNATSFSVAPTGTTTSTTDGSNKATIQVAPGSVTTTTQVGTGGSPTDYASVTIATNQIVDKVAAANSYTQTSASPTQYIIQAVGATSALTSQVVVNNSSINLTTGNGALATNGTSGTTSSLNSGGIAVYNTAQTIAPNTTIADTLNGRVYQNKVNGNLFVDGNVYVNGLLEYVSSNAATTTVTSGSTSILGPSLSTTGGTTIVMKDTNAAHAVVDANGKISFAPGVSEQSSSALTLTNGFGNVHGFMVNETQATMSGGIYSSSLTLNDNGATFSNSATGRPIQVHGVADGTASHDAVNVQQLNRGIAASMATAPQIGYLQPGESGLGVGFGSYGGNTALGLSFAHLSPANVQYNLGVAHGDGGRSTAVRAGVGWKW